ncbi:DUF4848 domain-containing protein [Pedobacter miscanthi]|uniref:DUF4848 domain-containing protein n=1 Tax=Pedobacter miscanthi TaxID=2259170 RepID=A0A366L6P3_9SPHI|nr:DUF4848 domain-containing protein [Pedobacter miscanthi]RBQ09133.1 hypothetical protein DRW42_08020 [Pedobacter miscanthi]
MKNKIYLMLIAFAVVNYSCKKQNTTIEEVTPAEVTLEKDHLAFKDYSTFISYYKALKGMSKSQRQSWESSLNFTSLQTTYEKFNGELDKLEKESKDKENYFRGFSELKAKYSGSLIFTEDSYRLNSSGSTEAMLINKDGFVKVGNDYLYFKETGMKTFKVDSYEKAQELSKSKAASTETQPLYAQAPSPNSFYPAIGGWNIIYKDRGRLLFRVKLYNLHSNALGYQSFASLEGMAEHRNVFGTYRGVNMSPGFTPDTGFTPYLAISYNNLTNDLYDILPHLIDMKADFFDGLSNIEHFDRVMCISKGLENNPQAASSIVNSGSEFSHYAVESQHTNRNDIYWRDIDNSFVQFSVLGQPGSFPFGSPAVFYGPFTLDCKNGSVQYQ